MAAKRPVVDPALLATLVAAPHKGLLSQLFTYFACKGARFFVHDSFETTKFENENLDIGELYASLFSFPRVCVECTNTCVVSFSFCTGTRC